VKIDPDLIVAEAFALMEEDGLDQLSLRRLASRFSVKAPAFYWHVAGKAELLRLMTEAIYREALQATPRRGDWRQWLLDFGHAFRRAMLRRRDAARLLAIAAPSRPGHPERIATLVTEPLGANGLDGGHALSFHSAVIALTLGWALYEDGGMHEFLSQQFDFDRAFGQSLAAMVAGFDPESPLPAASSTDRS